MAEWCCAHCNEQFLPLDNLKPSGTPTAQTSQSAKPRWSGSGIALAGGILIVGGASFTLYALALRDVISAFFGLGIALIGSVFLVGSKIAARKK